MCRVVLYLTVGILSLPHPFGMYPIGPCITQAAARARERKERHFWAWSHLPNQTSGQPQYQASPSPSTTHPSFPHLSIHISPDPVTPTIATSHLILPFFSASQHLVLCTLPSRYFSSLFYSCLELLFRSANSHHGWAIAIRGL